MLACCTLHVTNLAHAHASVSHGDGPEGTREGGGLTRVDLGEDDDCAGSETGYLFVLGGGHVDDNV